MVISYVYRRCFCLRKRKNIFTETYIACVQIHKNTHKNVYCIHSIPFHSVYILMRWEWEAIACSFNSPNDCIRMRWINWFRTKVDSKPEKYPIVHMVRSTNCQQYRFSLIFNAATSSQLVSCIQYLSSFYCNKFYIRPSFYLSPLAPFTWMYALKKYVPFVHKHEFHLRY